MKTYFNFDPLAWAGQTVHPTTANGTRASISPTIRNARPSNFVFDDDRESIMAVVQEVLDQKLNIAESYNDWLRLGFALAQGLGAQGRDAFHQISALSTKYNAAQCERKWRECLAKGDGRLTVATFFYLAKQAEIDLSKIGGNLPSNTSVSSEKG